MALSFAGIPAIGAAVVGWAAVVASQVKLNIVVVLIVAGLGAEASSLAGYSIGDQCVLPFGVSRLRVRPRHLRRRSDTVTVAALAQARAFQHEDH
jgi:membrane protein DedA with SNARE-associated domain